MDMATSKPIMSPGEVVGKLLGAYMPFSGHLINNLLSIALTTEFDKTEVSNSE